MVTSDFMVLDDAVLSHTVPWWLQGLEFLDVPSVLATISSEEGGKALWNVMLQTQKAELLRKVLLSNIAPNRFGTTTHKSVRKFLLLLKRFWTRAMWVK